MYGYKKTCSRPARFLLWAAQSALNVLGVVVGAVDVPLSRCSGNNRACQPANLAIAMVMTTWYQANDKEEES